MMAAQKSEAPLAGGAIAKENAEQALILLGSEAARKRFATLQARFALAGFALVRAAPGEAATAFYAVRWNWTKPLAGLDHAEVLLAQVAGAGSDHG